MGRSERSARQVVLVVEDEPLLRMMAVGFVEDAGYEALEACNADEAIKILEARGDIRLVFTDVDMPGSMDGLKLAAAVQHRWPPIQIIVTSGHLRFSEDMVPAHALFFTKPYDVAGVVSAMQRMTAH